MENILAKLVAMPTISDDLIANEQALDYIGSYLQERGMHIQRYVFENHGALVATIQPKVKKTRIMLYAHVDVMPATEEAFKLRRDGPKFVGRGVFDMKFAIAGYMHFIDQIQGKLNDYDFSIVITSDEEYGGRDDINSCPPLIRLGYAADVVVIPDGGRAWDVEYMCKGHWRFDLAAAGKSGHSSRPWEAESASFKLVQALHELRMAFKDHGPDTDTLNIGNIQADGTYNQIPSRMSAAVEIRLASEESADKNRILIDALCAKYDVEIKTRILERPLREDIDNPLLQGFMESITRVTGHPSKPCISMASSDAVYFRRAGIPCAVTYPPGGGHHSDREWLSREAFQHFHEIIRDYIEHHGTVNHG